MQPAVQQRTSGPSAARSRHTDPSDSYVRVLEVAAPVPFGHHGEEQAGENPSIMLHGISIAESCREGKEAAEKGMFCRHALQQGEKVGSLAISVRQEKRKRATGEFLLKRAADGATIGPACGSPTGDVSFAGAGKDSRRNSCTRHVLLISPTESLPFRERFCLSSIISVISHG